MNTSAKGRRYENRVRHKLESLGYKVTRSAASKGDWDLVATRDDKPVGWLQCKAGRFSCDAAQRLADALGIAVPMNCRGTVVHECRKGCRWSEHTPHWDCVHECP